MNQSFFITKKVEHKANRFILKKLSIKPTVLY